MQGGAKHPGDPIKSSFNCLTPFFFSTFLVVDGKKIESARVKHIRHGFVSQSLSLICIELGQLFT